MLILICEIQIMFDSKFANVNILVFVDKADVLTLLNVQCVHSVIYVVKYE